MSGLKIPKIRALDLRDPAAVARLARIEADDGFDWDWRESPDVSLDPLEWARREIAELTEMVEQRTALMVEVAARSMR